MSKSPHCPFICCISKSLIFFLTNAESQLPSCGGLDENRPQKLTGSGIISKALLE